MRPTAAETIAGADRLLRTVLAEDGLAPATAASLDSVLIMLRQLRVGWSARLPFLATDTRSLVALLVELAPALSPTLAADVRARCAALPQEPLLDLEAADALNASLRELLSQAIRELPASETEPRQRIRDYLLARLELEPA